ncbi:uncharacterized protein BCN122_II1353 [Burkholderia cenocepacia]|nr:uncharacterized protein BCN122_II1353 [Burkholderia cenocepacia]
MRRWSRARPPRTPHRSPTATLHRAGRPAPTGSASGRAAMRTASMRAHGRPMRRRRAAHATHRRATDGNPIPSR